MVRSPSVKTVQSSVAVNDWCSESQKAWIQVGFSRGEGQMLTLQIICLISNSEAQKAGQDCFRKNGLQLRFFWQSELQFMSPFGLKLNVDREAAQMKEDEKCSLVMNNSSKAHACPSVGYEYFHNCFLVNFPGIKVRCMEM